MGFLPILLLLSQDARGLSDGPHTAQVYPRTIAGSTELAEQDLSLSEYKGAGNPQIQHST